MLARNVGMYILNQKCAVVVGGTSGIGCAIAIGLARAGANVVSTSRSINAVETVAGEIETIGRSTLRHTSDMLDQNSSHSLHESVLAGFGRVDILVNSAGITKKMKTLECSDEDSNNIMAVNLTGTRAGQIFGASVIRQKLWANRGHRVSIDLCRLPRSRCLRRQQSASLCAHALACGGVGRQGHLRGCDRTRHHSYRAEPQHPGDFTWPGTSFENSDAPLRNG
jgi:NAD(P)-dependent dehydrogenase (short-subunit alcohol dehydrogenase family)